MEKSCLKCKHHPWIQRNSKFPCFSCFNYEDFEPTGLDSRKLIYLILWVLAYVLLIWVSITTSGCATGKEEIRNDPIPCEVCGRYDNRSVFLYELYSTSGQNEDFICHIECFNNLIRRTNDIIRK